MQATLTAEAIKRRGEIRKQGDIPDLKSIAQHRHTDNFYLSFSAIRFDGRQFDVPIEARFYREGCGHGNGQISCCVWVSPVRNVVSPISESTTGGGATGETEAEALVNALAVFGVELDEKPPRSAWGTGYFFEGALRAVVRMIDVMGMEYQVFVHKSNG